MIRSILALANARWDLAVAEVHSHTSWIKRQIVMAAFGTAFSLIAAILALALLVLLIPEPHRVVTVSALLALTLIVGVTLLLVVRSRFARRPRLLGVTKSVVKADLARIGLISIFRR